MLSQIRYPDKENSLTANTVQQRLKRRNLLKIDSWLLPMQHVSLIVIMNRKDNNRKVDTLTTKHSLLRSC